MLNCEHLQCCMIAFETMLNAKMHAALGTNVGGSYASVWLVTAHGTVPSPLCMRQVMILDQRHRSIGSSACMYRLPIGSEQLHQGMHELFSEIKLAWSMLADRPQLESGGVRMARLMCMRCEHSDERLSVLGSKRSCLLYSLRARVEKRRGRMEPKSALRAQQCSATEKSRSEDNNARRATTHCCARAALSVAAC